MKVLEYIVRECQRQQVEPIGVLRMMQGFEFAREHSFRKPMIDDLCVLAEMCEPNKNWLYASDNTRNFRKTPVTFGSGGSAVQHREIPDFVERLFRHLVVLDTKDIELVDQWCKDLLCVHPWVDANGRTVSLVRNWLLDTLDDPDQLPYYFE